MKTITLILSAVIFSMIIPGTGIAQEEDKLKLSFSNPEEPGFIKIEFIQGNINIQGYDGKEVLLESVPGKHESHEHEIPVLPVPDVENDEEISKEGLKKIESSSFEINITEEGNKITIKSGPPHMFQDYNVKVPYDCSFKINLVNGNISVKNVKGELEINIVNGKINLDKVTGSAVASTVNGTIKAVFKEVTPETPMAFSTINNHIDVTLPSNTKATLKMKTDRGDVYTDFDMDIKEKKEKSHKEDKLDSTSTSWIKWTTGNINGGGPELVFKSLNGDIHIRKGE